MADYIERTEELILAVNAGARVIENTKRYHGASYCVDVFAADHKEIPYLKAAEVLRGFDEIPAADVVPVVRCGQCKHWKTEDDHCTHPAGLCATGQKARNNYCSFGERKGGEG